MGEEDLNLSLEIPEIEEVGHVKQQNSQPNQEEQPNDQTVLQFLDSMDTYLRLMDSMSAVLRQGWLELASARHSMGASRISSTLLDLTVHSAETSMEVSECNVMQPHFILKKWASSNNEKVVEGKDYSEVKSPTDSDSSVIRCRSTSQFHEIHGKTTTNNGNTLTDDERVQKKRSKSLSVFGALVPPKLRAAQLSFETALEMLVDIANTRSSILSSFDQVKKELTNTKG